MPIETGPTPGETLFRKLAEEARALSFSERLQLVSALNGGRWSEVPDQLRRSFARVELEVKR
jgi:hypothetical protein